MTSFKTLFVTVLGLGCGLAQAQAFLSYGANASNSASGGSAFLDGSVSDGNYTSDGLQTATAGGSSAGVSVVADPIVGSFKSFTQALVSDAGTGGNADAYARLDLSDTLRFSGPGPTTLVQFILSWDTSVIGVGSLQAPSQVGPFGSFLQTQWFSSLSLGYLEPNPAYDPECVGFGEVPCPSDTVQVRSSGGHDLFTQANISSPGGAIQFIGMPGAPDGDGHFSGQTVVSMVVPTETDIELNYTAFNSSRCLGVAACNITTDASHSDYIGLSLADGVSFLSYNGYQYIGQTPAVPEPEAWLLGLVGVGVALARARRKPVAQPAA